jgi:hypothetical protein
MLLAAGRSIREVGKGATPQDRHDDKGDTRPHCMRQWR